MKLARMMTVFASVGSSTEKKSVKSDSNPVKRIENLGKNLSEWAESNLCRETDEGQKCLKSQAKWMSRVTQLTDRLALRYEKCGSVPIRTAGRRRRDDEENSEEDSYLSNDMDDQLFDFITSDQYGQASAASGMMARYAKNNPAKAVSQLCTAISKWTKDYLQSCQGRREMNNGYLQTVLRMAKWKIVLHNAYLKAQQIEENPSNKDSQIRNVPGNGSSTAWQKWFDRKTSGQKFR